MMLSVEGNRNVLGWVYISDFFLSQETAEIKLSLCNNLMWETQCVRQASYLSLLLSAGLCALQLS